MTNSKPHDLKGTLTAMADTLVMNLAMYQTGFGGKVMGASERPMVWFGTKWTMHVEVQESIVDANRGIIVSLVHFMGNLYGVLIADGQEGKLQFFLLDGSICGVTANERFFPKYWIREELYRRMHKGLKAAFAKGFYDKVWAPLDTDPKWMENYLERKRLSRAGRNQPAA